MNNEENRISKLESDVDVEIKARIDAMEDDGYVFPKRFTKRDYIITFVVVLACLALVIAGAFL